MRDRSEYIATIERIIGDPVPGDGNIEARWSCNSIAEARDLAKNLQVMQTELRLLKKEIGADIKEIRSLYVAQRTNVQAGFFASAFGGRGGAARDRANKRQQSKSGEAGAVAPYEALASMVDDMLLQIDRAKIKAATFIRENPEPRAQPVRSAKPVDYAAQIRALKDLLDEGLITQVEFDAKKADLLSRI